MLKKITKCKSRNRLNLQLSHTQVTHVKLPNLTKSSSKTLIVSTRIASKNLSKVNTRESKRILRIFITVRLYWNC